MARCKAGALLRSKSMKRNAKGIPLWIAALWVLSVLWFPLAGCPGEEPVRKEADTSKGTAFSEADREEKAPVEQKEQEPPVAKDGKPRVRMKTSAGDIVLELNRELAPVSVENFLAYVKDGAYDGTIFHRVIAGFMIQGGGFDTNMKKRPTQSPIRNEAHNGLKNLRGTLAMARTQVVDSATNQFFINCKDNGFLDHRGKEPRGYGYAVLGKVLEGMDVVERIEKVPTGRKGPLQDVPVEDVIIESVQVESP